MTRRILRLVVVPLVALAAVLAAPAAAVAQVDTSDLPEYPGPFDDAVDETSPPGSEVADEVLGQTLDGLVVAEGEHTTERSMDYIGDDAATHFQAPDIQPTAIFIDDGDVLFADREAPPLANTGSEVEPIIAISVGMLAVGGSVLVGSRRRLRDLFR